MQKKIFLFIGVAIAALSIAVSVGLTMNVSTEKFNTLSLPELEFTYDESNLTLKQDLGGPRNFNVFPN